MSENIVVISGSRAADRFDQHYDDFLRISHRLFPGEGPFPGFSSVYLGKSPSKFVLEMVENSCLIGLVKNICAGALERKAVVFGRAAGWKERKVWMNKQYLESGTKLTSWQGRRSYEVLIDPRTVVKMEVPVDSKLNINHGPQVIELEDKYWNQYNEINSKNQEYSGQVFPNPKL